MEEISSREEGSNKGPIPNADIKERLSIWTKIQSLVDKWHPYVAIVNQNIRAFDDNVIDYFRKVLKSRGNIQLCTNCLLSRSSAKQIPSPELELPDVLIGGDNPPK